MPFVLLCLQPIQQEVRLTIALVEQITSFATWEKLLSEGETGTTDMR